MRIDPFAASTVAAIIRDDLKSIQKLNAQLDDLHGSLSQANACFRDLAAGAYVLHNLYNAFENSFEHISRAFENHVKDPSQWHKELLGKMFLDLREIRPPVLSLTSKKLLNELRGFRHLFRHSYDFEIDQGRLLHLLDLWREESEVAIKSLDGFQSQLVSLLSEKA